MSTTHIIIDTKTGERLGSYSKSTAETLVTGKPWLQVIPAAENTPQARRMQEISRNVARAMANRKVRN